MRNTTRLAVLAAAVATTFALVSPAGRAATWAPAATAPIHPGVQTVTSSGQCTANFVFTAGSAVYIGQASHCGTLGGESDLNGCTTQSIPLGSPVQIGGASRPGTLVYSSWRAMQAAGETDVDTCNSNDFALVQIASGDLANVNPSVPHWGGPMGVNTSGAALADLVYSYGNSSLRAGVTLLSPKLGIGLGDDNVWAHNVSTITPGIPGDSGSAFLDSSGRALGVLQSIVAGTPWGVWNGVTDIGHEVAYAQGHGVPGLTLANGTEAFNGGQLPLDLAHPLG